MKLKNVLREFLLPDYLMICYDDSKNKNVSRFLQERGFIYVLDSCYVLQENLSTEEALSIVKEKFPHLKFFIVKFKSDGEAEEIRFNKIDFFERLAELG